MRRFTPSPSRFLSLSSASSLSWSLLSSSTTTKRFQNIAAETNKPNGLPTSPPSSSSSVQQENLNKPQVVYTPTSSTFVVEGCAQQQNQYETQTQEQRQEPYTPPTPLPSPPTVTPITLGFLGCGNMSAAILKGLVKAAAACPKEVSPIVASAAGTNDVAASSSTSSTTTNPPLAPGDYNTFLRQISKILIFDPSIKPGSKKGENFHINLKKMNPSLNFEILDSAEELAERSSVAVIGVKPQVARQVLYPLRGLWGKKTASAKSVDRPTVVVSVIAGETILSLEEMLLPPEFTERIRREEELALKQIELDDQIDAADELLASNPHLASAADLDPNEKKQVVSSSSSSAFSLSEAQQQQQLAALAPLEPSHLCVVRSMPNTPLLVGKGVSAYSLSTENLQRAVGATSDQGIPKATEKFVHDATAAIFGSGQNTLAFVPESQLDAVSGVSSCGPAFISMVVESLADGGVMQGLPRALANRLAAETVHGASAMLCGDKPAISSAAEMRHQVCSPGGATIAGVHKLEEKGLRDALMCAVRQSAQRCGELRREGEQQATIMRKKQRVAAITKKRNSQYYALQKSQVKKRSGSGGRPKSPGK